MSLSVDAIRENLIEIKSLTEAQADAPEKALVANIKETQIYNAKKGLGRLWSWFYAIKKFFTGKEEKKYHLVNTLVKTQESFDRRKSKADDATVVFDKAFSAYPTDRREYKEALKELDIWVHTFYPFAKEINNNNSTHFLEPFKWAIRKNGGDDSKTNFEGFKDFDFYKQYHRLIRFKLLIGKETPLKIFEKCLAHDKLSNNEEEELEKWIHRVQDKAPKSYKKAPTDKHITPNFLHKVLKSLFPKNDNLADLENYLSLKGLKLASDPDYKTFKKRRQISKGAVFQGTNGKSWTIDEEIIGGSSKELDDFLVFTLQKEPKYVAIFGLNASLLARKKFLSQQNAFGIPHVETKYHDPKGLFIIQERIHKNLKEIASEYKKTGDKGSLEPLIKLVEGFKELKNFPNQLLPHRLGVNFEGELRTSYSLEANERNFKHYVDFLWVCCQKDREIFLDLIRYSQLDLDKGNKFYKKLLQAHLKISSQDSKKIIKENEHLKDLPDFLKKIDEIYENSLKNIFNNYHVADTEKLAKKLPRAILNYWKLYCVGSFLWSDAEKKVCEKIVSLLDLKAK